jgi:hypothetical protein
LTVTEMAYCIRSRQNEPICLAWLVAAVAVVLRLGADIAEAVAADMHHIRLVEGKFSPW